MTLKDGKMPEDPIMVAKVRYVRAFDRMTANDYAGAEEACRKSLELGPSVIEITRNIAFELLECALSNKSMKQSVVRVL